MRRPAEAISDFDRPIDSENSEAKGGMFERKTQMPVMGVFLHKSGSPGSASSCSIRAVSEDAKSFETIWGTEKMALPSGLPAVAQ
jgi:hypothetical protein